MIKNWTRAEVARVLNSLPYVTWDRMTTAEFDGNEELHVYGWIPRSDFRYDFVVVEFVSWVHQIGSITSSDMYSIDISLRLGRAVSEHVPCKRVETEFGDLVHRTAKRKFRKVELGFDETKPEGCGIEYPPKHTGTVYCQKCEHSWTPGMGVALPCQKAVDQTKPGSEQDRQQRYCTCGMPIDKTHWRCENCHGSGRVYCGDHTEPCPHCHGTGNHHDAGMAATIATVTVTGEVKNE